MLRQRRRALGLTQEELASRSGLTTGTIRRTERGSTQPHRGSLVLLCGALGLAADDLNNRLAGQENTGAHAR